MVTFLFSFVVVVFGGGGIDRYRRDRLRCSFCCLNLFTYLFIQQNSCNLFNIIIN